jgi:mono/diheme cytochrome c family protein
MSAKGKSSENQDALAMQPLPESVEPTAGSRALPGVLIAFLAFMFYWGDIYVMDNGGDLMGKNGSFPEAVYYPYTKYAEIPTPGGDDSELGRIAYQKYCQACHQPNGMGAPGSFPPLAGSEWVLADGPNRIIRIVLDGLSGPITVKGQQFNSVMVPWRDVIADDKEIAALLTFIRTEWGNSASEVTPEQVTEVRGATSSRAGRSWTAAELEKIPTAN